METTLTNFLTKIRHRVCTGCFHSGHRVLLRNSSSFAFSVKQVDTRGKSNFQKTMWSHPINWLFDTICVIKSRQFLWLFTFAQWKKLLVVRISNIDRKFSIECFWLNSNAFDQTRTLLIKLNAFDQTRMLSLLIELNAFAFDRTQRFQSN